MDNLRGIKVAILVVNGFEQVELVKPKEALEQAGAETFIISPEKTVQGWNHDEKADVFSVDILLEKASPAQFDALLLPGGVMNPDSLRVNAEAIHFIQEINRLHKPIAAICHGPWTLINAMIAKDHRLTSFHSIKMDLINAGANWVDEAAVTDDNLVTSRKPEDIPAFNKAFIHLLSKLKKNSHLSESA